MARAASQWKSSKRDSTFFDQQQPNNEMNTPTPTPRTDAAWNATFDGEQMSAGRTARALRECSQQLETELAALTAERDYWQKIAVSASREREHNANVAQAMTAERDQLRADLDAIKAILTEEKDRAARAEGNLAALEQSFDDNCRGVVRIAAELATERARLDSGQILLTVSGERVWHCGVDLRAAIDAGMKEGAK